MLRGVLAVNIIKYDACEHLGLKRYTDTTRLKLIATEHTTFFKTQRIHVKKFKRKDLKGIFFNFSNYCWSESETLKIGQFQLAPSS